MNNQLQPSVLSSSSLLRLQELIQDTGLISDVSHFDLLVPRPCDLPSLSESDRRRRLSYFLANQDWYQTISEQIESELRGSDVTIPAFATFFPNISSSNSNEREEAIRAIVNVFKLAATLEEWMTFPPVVEIVCGTVVEAASSETVNIYCVEQKIDYLMASLTQIVQEVQEEFTEFAIALELEPGDIYLVNDANRIRKVFKRCEASETLRNHVGLNVDIAHMRIAGVSTDDLQEFMPRICHSHISDHPGIHTHDQMVGSWTNIEQLDGGYLPYLQQLQKRFDVDSSLPYTGCIAIELEGCNRIFTIHDSVTRLHHCIEMLDR